MTHDADAIANCVLQTFDALPPKFKPRKSADGRREWVPLAGVVLSREGGGGGEKDRRKADDNDDDDTSLTCVSLATGMKCLPREKIPRVQGSVLHDWHAEVLCLRGFNRWVLDECQNLLTTGQSLWLTKTSDALPPFALQHDIRLHFFCTQAPCGDSSMELTMSQQEDATPWEKHDEEGTMPGRGNFDLLGVVRRKPARADAPRCWSKSCSDKLSMRQVTGILSSVTSLFVEPCWLATLVLPEGEVVSQAMERAFGRSGRMGTMGEDVRPFDVRTTKRDFGFSRSAAGGEDAVSSNLSALWTPRRREVLINGVLQGRKQMDPRGASCASRRRMWESAVEVAERLDSEGLKSLLGKNRAYGDIKGSEMLAARREVKKRARETALRGWMRNDGDEDWRLESQ